MPRSLVALAFVAALALAVPARAELATFFVIDTIKVDNGEIAVGTLVQRRGSSQQVRDLGAMMARDHAAIKAQAIETGRTVGVGVPTVMTAETQELLRKLESLSGQEFDNEFLTSTIKGHRKAIDKFAEQGRSGDPVTSKLALDALPHMREHLRIALSLR